MSELAMARVGTLEDLRAAIAGWGLAGSAPVAVLVGGASGMTPVDDEQAARALRRGIVPAIAAEGAVLLDGGTDSGVMRLAGEARREMGADFPLIGVLPADTLDLPEHEGDTVARIQPDHSHLLAVPGERWGDETPWLFAAAGIIAGDHPVVTIVLNGGEIALDELDESVRLGYPVIAVEGTGRAADAIAGADRAAGAERTTRPDAPGGPDDQTGPGSTAGGGSAAPGDEGSRAPADPSAARLAARARALQRSGLVRSLRSGEDDGLRDALRTAFAPRTHGGGMTGTAPARSEAAPSYASYEDEMRALIDRTDVGDQQRHFLRSRWLDQVTYMGDRASEAKRRYYTFRLATVIGGVVVPAMVSISLAGSGRFDENLDFLMRLLTFAVSALVAVTAAVEGFLHFGDRWRHFRVNAELLKSEGWQYLTHSGVYRKVDDPEEAFQAFAARVETLLRDDVEGFMTNVAQSSPIEKHDIFTKV